jgi:hypothetical protein
MAAKGSRIKCIPDNLISVLMIISAFLVFFAALGIAQPSDTISITVPTFDPNWVLDPRTNPNTQSGDLVVDSSQPWSVTVSSDTPDGKMAQSVGEDYIGGGKKLHTPLKIAAESSQNVAGYEVDLSQNGVLAEGEAGNFTIPVTLEQYTTWQDEALNDGTVYHMAISLIASPSEISCTSPPQIESVEVTPGDGNVMQGGTATLHVVTSGSGLSYQWFKGHNVMDSGCDISRGTFLRDGGHISGAKTDTLTISNFGCRDNGCYFVAVSNLCGFNFSEPYVLNVIGPY